MFVEILSVSILLIVLFSVGLQLRYNSVTRSEIDHVRFELDRLSRGFNSEVDMLRELILKKIQVASQEVAGIINSESSKTCVLIDNNQFKARSYVDGEIKYLNGKLDRLSQEFENGFNHFIDQLSPIIEETTKKAERREQYRDPVTGFLSMKAVRKNVAMRDEGDLRVVDIDKEG